MINRASNFRRADSVVRCFTASLLLLSFSVTNLLYASPEVKEPVRQGLHKTESVEAIHGFVPPNLIARAAIYSELQDRGALPTASGWKANQEPQIKKSTRKSFVLIYDAGKTLYLPGIRARFEPAGKVDNTAVDDAYAYQSAMRSFLKKVYRRKSIDDKGADLIGTVNSGLATNNAMWMKDQLIYGDCDGLYFNTVILPEIVGHELFHAVTQNTSNLMYEGQSGALNEHLADVFGVLFRQWLDDISVDKDNWLIGTNLFTARVNGRAMRDMRYPGTAFKDDFLGKDNQSAHMKDFVVTTMDNGGIHSNSGIPNKAFATFAIAVGGKAWKTAGQIWFDTATDGYLKEDSNFQDFANATLVVCSKQFPKEADKLKAAWAAVGITVG